MNALANREHQLEDFAWVAIADANRSGNPALVIGKLRVRG